MHRSGQPAPVLVAPNTFAALESKSKSRKKKSSKDKDDKAKNDKAGPQQPSSTSGLVGQTSSASTGFGGLNNLGSAQISNWADEDSDDDFIAPMASWVQEHQQSMQARKEAEHEAETQRKQEQAKIRQHEIEAQLGVELVQDDDSDEEEEEEPESRSETTASRTQSRQPSELTPAAAARQAQAKLEEKQLSKKELKKKGLQELEQVLKEMGQDVPTQDSEAGAPAVESEAARKRRLKKERQKLSGTGEVSANGDATKDTAETVPAGAPSAEELPPEPAVPVDTEQVKKKLAVKTPKKPPKKAVNPAIAKAAAEEAKKRTKKEAAQKEKDRKKHYNQERR